MTYKSGKFKHENNKCDVHASWCGLSVCLLACAVFPEPLGPDKWQRISSHLFCCPQRAPMDNELHIGKTIKAELDRQGRKVSWLATQLNCTRDNCYKLFQRQWIDTCTLLKVSKILNHDFFAHYSEYVSKNDDV